MPGEQTDAVETELALMRKQLEIIRNVSGELNKLIGLKDKLNNILKILDEQFGIAHSLIYMPDENKKMLSVFAGRGYVKEHDEVAFGKGIAGMAAERAQVINITGLRRKMHYMTIVQDSKPGNLNNISGADLPESQVAIPLLSGNKLVAVLVAESEKSSVFSMADERFLLTLTTPIAVSIQNSILFDTMETKISERTAELELLNHTKNKLFSIISHDLRSPVTSFQGITQLLNHYIKKGETDKIIGISDHIDQSASRLNFLLDNLLNWSLSQENGISCSFEKIIVKSFIDEIIALYKDSATAKNIEITVSMMPAAAITGDHHTLSVVFRNLLHNAIKFTPRNGAIRISVKNDNNLVTIAVSDSGSGIADNKLAFVFDMKERKSTAGTEKERGTGLGLILVHEFVLLNKGNISVQSAPGHGAEFLVHLPSAND